MPSGTNYVYTTSFDVLEDGNKTTTDQNERTKSASPRRRIIHCVTVKTPYFCKKTKLLHRLFAVIIIIIIIVVAVVFAVFF